MGRRKATKPTRNQKIIMSKSGLLVNNWLVLEETKTELRLVSRGSGARRTIKSPHRSWRFHKDKHRPGGAIPKYNQLQYSTSGPEREEDLSA